jgi:hypothetical protein
MPLVNLHPMNKRAEIYLKAQIGILRPLVKEIIVQTYEVPEHNVIVTAFKNEVLSGDPEDADVRFVVATNPNPKIEAKADKLRNEIIRIWWMCYFTSKEYVGPNDGFPKIDIWLQFIPGSWGLSLTMDTITDSFDHVVQDKKSPRGFKLA